MEKAHAEQILRSAVGRQDATFRVGQWEAIDSLVNGRRKLLIVQRTGWGKSSVYFVSTRIMRDRGFGPTVIVSPLLALMRDQIQAADRLGIQAETINSSNQEEWQRIKGEVLADQVDALLISPERLANEDFVAEVLQPIAGRLGLLVVDEAHCISDWGHDFRPDYKRIVNILKQLPKNTPVLGTTATANQRVVEDVKTQLGEIDVVKGSLNRESLRLQTVRLPDQATRLAWLSEYLPTLPGTGIVYVLTQRDCKQVSEWLALNGIRARAYYSDVTHADYETSNEYRQALERSLLHNELKVLVATTALGMGYDKPDLQFVVHYQSPSSVVAYYQQVGRAGRQVDEAFGILLSGREDTEIHEYFRRSAFPHESHVTTLLQALEAEEGLTVPELEERVNLRRGQLQKVLKYLSVQNPAPIIKDGAKWRRTPVSFSLDREAIQRLTEQREWEWREIQSYIDAETCLMEFLQRALDDPEAGPCGQCAVCLGEPLVGVEVPQSVAIQATSFLKQAEMPLQPKKQVAGGAFQEYRFRGNLPMALRAQEGRILSRWNDAGWGGMVAADKHAGRFREALVSAAAEMVAERWRPDPPPAWVACIPSLNHPDLVPDLARRLARELNLPFVPVVKKVKDNQPQKNQENRFHQCRNLDGAFALEGEVPEKPALLIDDVVDSGWTMTVVAALLRQGGCGPVYPLALASTSSND